MISEALRKKEHLKIPVISFSQGTIFSNDLEEASFDKIISFDVIHLLEDKQEVIHRINKLLKPGGLFISATACIKSQMTFKNRLEVTAYIFMKRPGISPLHLNQFTLEDVGKTLTDKHFQIVESEEFFTE